MKGDWMPRDGFWWQETEDTKNHHGIWGGRLSCEAIPCMEIRGYSMWHLLAAKALPQEVARMFLHNASEQASADGLIDDLREVMTVFDDAWRQTWLDCSGLRVYRFGWKRLQRETAFRTPLQICERLGVPLITFDISQEWPEIHPVIEAAQTESLRRMDRGAQ
ncbi:MAG: hypothetical protein GVY36_17110 [Verrucomicrobia bacterium]|jgi:hypothetical protein|nr:hypothetical protein [Verrucomicrobiota bacterium]